jgi:hypothetical protein
VPVGFACAYTSVRPVNRYLIVAAGCLLALGNMETFRRSTVALLEMPTFRSAKEREAVIRVAQSYSGGRTAVAIDSNDPISICTGFRLLITEVVRSNRSRRRNAIHFDARYCPMSFRRRRIGSQLSCGLNSSLLLCCQRRTYELSMFSMSFRKA